MKSLITHPLTASQLNNYQQNPSQVILLVAPAGSGKSSLARRAAEEVLKLSPGSFDDHQYTLLVQPTDGKAIGIDAARAAERFLSLKVPGAKQWNRAIIIENAHTMTTEAQNALLKTLEEPPAGTIILLTATHGQSLLPTIRSRAQIITIQRPRQEDLRSYFSQQDFAEDDIRQAYAMSGGLPGLMHVLLEDEDHPLRAAAQEARQLLSQPLFERLITVDGLSKQRELAVDTIDILQQMAHLGLQNTGGKAARRWQSVLRASYDAAEALQSSAQLKLVLTDMVLRF